MSVGEGRGSLARVLVAASLLIMIGAVVFQQRTGGSTEGAELQGQSNQHARAEEQVFQTEIDLCLKNAATVTETYAMSNGNSYKGLRLSPLEQVCLRITPAIQLSILRASADSYCLQSRHIGLDESDEWYLATYAWEIGQPRPDDTC